jgi:hypothetical protein
MLVPHPCQGTNNQIDVFSGYEWIKKLPNKKIYFALFQRWPDQPLPLGYDYYIVSFHLETVDIAWLKQQQVTGMIIALFDGHNYNLEIPGVHFIPFFYWHYQLQTMQDWFGPQQEKKQSLHKFSAVCNRISQSKIWITTKLLETAKSSSMIVLNSWLEEKNVHHWQLTGNTVLDQLTQIFRNKYLGQEIKIDNFDNSTDNRQSTTATPWQPLYQACAIHFTNESFHYSQMLENEDSYIWPGPFITEKTLKCLAGGTAMIPVGQFETYKTLTNLGLEFNYDFDISWDSDSGNLTRSTKIINLIDRLNEFDVEQLITMTQDSNKFNQNYIVSGQFFNQCQKINNESIQLVHDLMH